jgi:hypothetical protein
VKKALLSTALLLSACAPTYTGPKPAPNEVIVENVAPDRWQLFDSKEGSRSLVVGWIAVMPWGDSFDGGLPTGYEPFTSTSKSKGSEQTGEQSNGWDIYWQSVNPTNKHTVNVRWTTQPLGGKLVRVGVTAAATDAAVNTQHIEDTLLRAFVKSKIITLVARGR